MKREHLDKKIRTLQAYSFELQKRQIQSTPKLKGHIKCNRCHRAMIGDICLTRGCTSARCYIDVYWGGKKYRYFKYYIDRKKFNYERAVKQLQDMNAAMEKGTFNPVDWTEKALAEIRLTYQAALWLLMKEDEAKAGELSHRTLVNYQGYVAHYFIPHLGERNVREIKYEDLERFKDELRRVKGIKTRRNIMNALHALFAWMRRRGTIKELPVFPTIEGDNSNERIALDYETQQKALANIPEEHRDALEFGMETGLRSGEIGALQVGDIDIINRQALIRRTWSGAVLKETTKGRSKKWIPLSDRAFEIATKHSQGKLPSAFVFINPETGRHYPVKKFNTIWRTYSGVDCDYYSASRHSFCTQLGVSGANQFDAQALMRHVDVRTTGRYYHPTSDRLRRIVNLRGKQPIARALPESKEAK